jgi:hypothetical protein
MKKLLKNFLMYIGYAISAAILFTYFANLAALSVMSLALVGAVLTLAYFHLRRPND